MSDRFGEGVWHEPECPPTPEEIARDEWLTAVCEQDNDGRFHKIGSDVEQSPAASVTKGQASEGDSEAAQLLATTATSPRSASRPVPVPELPEEER